MDQLQARLPAVLRVHERFRRKPKRLGGLSIPSTEDMIARCADIEKRVPAPFSVRIHGDFNVNNLVYNHEDQRIHFIDLYRSRDADYVQDASVFLVSNFRLPVFEPRLRERIDRVIAYFFKVFERFARNSGDDLFHIRMALALARSFYTSARFELNDRFAGEMYLKSTYLMETVINHKDSRAAYRLPDTVLYCQDI
jgi:Ser/Thr protein kinase RdoA (MazF antagonist)